MVEVTIWREGPTTGLIACPIEKEGQAFEAFLDDLAFMIA
jgi:hypothetical protein